MAFASYVVALETRCRGVPGVEITIFTILFQAIGYAVAMLIANGFYSLGAIVERRVAQGNIDRYRRYAYWSGVCFSVALPLTIPALVWILGCQPGPV